MSWNHDHTSSVANTRTGASSRSWMSSARRKAARADTAPGSAPSPSSRVRAVGAVLDQLEVVVAERPEERLRHLEGPGVVERLVRRRREVDHLAQAGQHGPVEGFGDERGEALGVERLADVAERQGEPAGVEHLDGQPAADLHLRGVERRVDAEPGGRRPVADAVAAVLLEHVEGVVALPLDLLIFLRSGSRIQPLSVACRHGSEPNS